MRAVVQRVIGGSVSVGEAVIGRIGTGLVVLLGVAHGDGPGDAEYLANKIANLRVFPDEEGKMNRSVLEAGGRVLVVSQFTLLGDCRQGSRPGFAGAAPAEEALALYRSFVAHLRGRGIGVEEGRFGARMLVEIRNDGPVTLLLDSRKLF